MIKFSRAKATSAVKNVLILLVGIIGAKALKGIVEAKFPQFAQYTNYGVLAAAIAGTMAGKAIVADVAKGSLLFGAVQLINQFVPASASKYIPRISGLGNAGMQYQIPADSMRLGQPSMANSLASIPG